MTSDKCLLQAIRERIDAASVKRTQTRHEVRLLAVSKMVTAERVRALALQGQMDFGENYVQEGMEKIIKLNDLSLVWHFIGPIQRNKTTVIATHFDWVHSIDRGLVAQRLSAARPAHGNKLNVCVQVNLDNEESKSGVSVEDLPALLTQIVTLPNLCLRGLMMIPRPTANPIEQRAQFVLLRQLFERMGKLLSLSSKEVLCWDTLSMGMSGDFELAVEEGATCVRVGTALFGHRSSGGN